MNLDCVKTSELFGDYDSNKIAEMPKQFIGKIKTKTKVVFNLETETDFWNSLEFCRFIMVKELPDEIKNYIKKNANDPQLIKRLNKEYYDFYNKEINHI